MGPQLKSYMLSTILKVTESESDEAIIAINREKAINTKNNDLKYYVGENSIFQMMRKGFPSDPQTILDNATRPFEIKFAGEGGIDAGGLFR